MKRFRQIRVFWFIMACTVFALTFLTACNETEQAAAAPETPAPPPVTLAPEPSLTPEPTPELILEAIRQAARDAGYEVKSNEQVLQNLILLNSPYSNIKDGFLVHIVLGNQFGTVLLEDDYRIYECVTEADAQANAALTPFILYEGKYVVNGRFFAEYLKRDDSDDAVLAKLAECLESILKCNPIPAQEMNGLELAKGTAQPQTAGGMVTLVIPASLFTVTTEEQVRADAAAMGVDVTRNGDGSYTYVMTAEQQQKTLDDFRRQLTDNMAEIPGQDAYKDSVKAFSYNSDFSEIKITLNRKDFAENSFAQMAVRIICLLAPNYQAFSGNPAPVTVISLIDDSTGKVYKTASSPDDFINAADDLFNQ